ncbi:Nucleotide-binding universal stress protein, UspA family [Sanguibacter gelidistatuariae]|uniref:Nucleotide-binding universal stress protein, UspA family n=2 Tax=Sanguibacter gelidistatuariae TaxID=1814289 RepID=A0A1G6K1J6_9MICO|nr:Nucleotide-binding universal stress protein, UspA family [Sanguibacter gelidistatuariae]
MRTHLDLPIVVGVNGSPESDRAVRYSVHRADRIGCGLLLVNAVHEIVPISPMWPLLTGDSLMDVGRGILADARVLVEKIAGAKVPVDVHAALGPAVSVLAGASADARLVVVGHRPGGALEHLFTGTTTFGVVARASCPVVSVTREWDEHRARRRVVAAVDGSAVSSSVLAHAFAIASETSADLDVVHCWKLDSLYAYLVDEMSVQQEWGARTASVISAFVDEWTGRYPDVRVATHMEYADVTRTLVRHSKDADVLVVGRHGHGGIEGRLALSAPGSIARALVQHAHCPVEFVPLAIPSSAEPPIADTSRLEASDL